MNTVIFRTPTILDLRAITTFGLHAKPNSKSPIGFFGTGLKMAIAVLVRNQIPVTIYIGNTAYVFYTKDNEFRDTTYQSIRMKKRDGLLGRWQYEELPFTTQLAKQWQLWMAFRELESNTRDENGSTSIMTAEWVHPQDSESTTIVVGPSEAFFKVAKDIDTIFLPDGLREPTVDLPKFQIFDRPGHYIYYRGMRVLELDKPSLFTYNVLDTQELTEDRTLRYVWWLQDQVARYLVASEDRALVNRYLNVTSQNWEYDLPYDMISGASPTFLEVVKKRKTKELKDIDTNLQPLWASGRVSTLYSRHAPRALHHNLLSTYFSEWLSRQRVDGENITDADMQMLTKAEADLKDNDTEYYP